MFGNELSFTHFRWRLNVSLHICGNKSMRGDILYRFCTFCEWKAVPLLWEYNLNDLEGQKRIILMLHERICGYLSKRRLLWQSGIFRLFHDCGHYFVDRFIGLHVQVHVQYYSVLVFLRQWRQLHTCTCSYALRKSWILSCDVLVFSSCVVSSIVIMWQN